MALDRRVVSSLFNLISSTFILTLVVATGSVYATAPGSAERVIGVQSDQPKISKLYTTEFLKMFCSGLAEDGWGPEVIQIVVDLKKFDSRCKYCAKFARKFEGPCKAAQRAAVATIEDATAQKKVEGKSEDTKDSQEGSPKSKEKAVRFPVRRLEPNVPFLKKFTQAIHLLPEKDQSVVDELNFLGVVISRGYSSRDIRAKSYFEDLDSHVAPAIESKLTRINQRLGTPSPGLKS